MKPGDECIGDLPLWSVVQDEDGDAWLRVKGHWQFAGMHRTFDELRKYSPLTVLSVGPSAAEPEPEPEWEPVEPEDVRVGDEIEVVDGGTVESLQGFGTSLPIVICRTPEGGSHSLVVSHPLRRSLRRRVRPAMPEPGPGAVVEVDGQRWARIRIRTNGAEDTVWACLDSLDYPLGSDWPFLLATGTPTVLLPAVTP